MADSNDLYAWRVNNYFDYVGKLGPYPMSKIKEPIFSGDNLLNYFSTHKKRPDGFAAYPNEMREISLTPAILLKLGFQFNETSKVYLRGATSLIHLSYSEGDDPLHQTLYGPSTWVFKPNVAVPLLPRQVKKEYIFANAVEVATLQAFQNYCKDNSINVDFSVLE